jgi:hypothetical protein
MIWWHDILMHKVGELPLIAHQRGQQLAPADRDQEGDASPWYQMHSFACLMHQPRSACLVPLVLLYID